jgi:hypothetical protein
LFKARNKLLATTLCDRLAVMPRALYATPSHIYLDMSRVKTDYCCN